MNSDSPIPTMAVWLEQAWLERYLDRALSDHETAWFEAYVLDRAHLLEAIDVDTRLRDACVAGAPAIESAGAPEVVAVGTDSVGTGRASPHRRRQPLFAVAAALLAGIGISGWITNSASRSAMLEANPTRIVYDTMRGIEEPARVENSASSTRFVLVEIAVPSAAEDVELGIEGLPKLALSPSPEGFVSFLIDRSSLSQARAATLHYALDGKDRSRHMHFGPLSKGE